MNSIPPSRDFLCVGNGPSDRALHPDRAPYTQLAEQNGVILFSGTAPQQGVNFSLSAGSLVYRNQMSTLGSSEPAPQIGVAGTLLQRPWDFVLPWTEARWHPGEDIAWQGFRRGAEWLEGIPSFVHSSDNCGSATSGYLGDESDGTVYKPCTINISDGNRPPLQASSILSLVPGIYQLGKVNRTAIGDNLSPGEMREPWFTGVPRKPAFNVELSTSDTHLVEIASGQHNPLLPDDWYESPLRIAKDFYPNFLNVYPFRELDLDAGRLKLHFERSATWPREESQEGTAGAIRGTIVGTVFAESANDAFGNTVHMDRVPKYGWETDFKLPSPPANLAGNDSNFTPLEGFYEYVTPVSSAWRLPHKRLRTVRLIPKGNHGAAEANGPFGKAAWTIAFVYEHPESDRIAAHDVDDSNEWKSIYSHLPQNNWDTGRLPELNDSTTLLTVQVYEGDPVINGARFQDDYSVWASTIHQEGGDTPPFHRVNAGLEFAGDLNEDGKPGIAGIDDDGDGLIDEDCMGLEPGDEDYDVDCPATEEDDNEDCDSCGAGCTRCLIASPVAEEILDGRAVCSDPPQEMDLPGETAKCPGRCEVDDDGDGNTDETSVGLASSTSHYDPFYVFDDDEDGIYDEDGADDPLLVHLRSIDGECASGIHPYAPSSQSTCNDEGSACQTTALMPGQSWTKECRPVFEAKEDPWVHQVQYVYARNNPYWLLSWRNSEKDFRVANYGRIEYLTQPRYYYFAPFKPDIITGGTCLHPAGASTSEDCGVDENNLVTAASGDFAGYVIHAQEQPNDEAEQGNAAELPNVHPDCVPDRDYTGPQGYSCGLGNPPYPAVGPSDIHLIKRIVRTRPDKAKPLDIIEQTWLYRYNDFGFLKAVFDPAAVQAILDADSDDAFDDPDDIMQYADTHPIEDEEGNKKPLIMYASQWYTYYNPMPPGDFEYADIPPCYEEPPYALKNCTDIQSDELGLSSPFSHLPPNVCDGEKLWNSDYTKEMHTDPPCSEFLRNDCGVCAFGVNCEESAPNTCSDDDCDCPVETVDGDSPLAQMGISGAKERFRKHLIKTARVRGGDGQMHTYRFDYLGSASSAYESGHITSYADAHNVTIVDELVEQTNCEFPETHSTSSCGPGSADAERNRFYIYEDDFKFVLDPSPQRYLAPTTYDDSNSYMATTHYLYMPVKVKTRRVVTMNYYGIAMSDRLILTPGFNGTQTQLVNDQQYELVNKRGQAVHVYDPSWVAAFRQGIGQTAPGIDAIRESGRVLVELFGGEKGMFSVLRGIAWGSNGGNMYDQQCKTPPVLADVPVQRVTEEQLDVVSATKHTLRTIDGNEVKDLPAIEVAYSVPLSYSALNVTDPANMIGDSSEDTGCDQDNEVEPQLDNQEPVEVNLDSTPNEPGDGKQVTRYWYAYHDDGNPNLVNESAVQWKWQWQEAVPAAQGGSGKVALEIWYFDVNGRIRFYGRGAGSEDVPPEPEQPFVVSYFGYDEFGRMAIQVDDLGLGSGGSTSIDKSNLDAGDLNWPDIAAKMRRIATGPAADLVTKSVFDLSGALKSRIQGIAASSANGLNDTGSDWGAYVRTDYKTVGQRHITFRNEENHIESAWNDPHIYQFAFQHVRVGTQQSPGDKVHGTTSVRILDKSGKPIEDRIISWNSARGASGMQDMINPDHDLWAIKLTDYTSNNVGENEEQWNIGDLMPEKLWAPECNGVFPCYDEENLNISSEINPSFPGSRELGHHTWPPGPEGQIVTLARSFKLYKQRSSLKPTHEVVYRSFDEASEVGESASDIDKVMEDRRAVVREYSYDLEDRIARQEEPDGTITRLLFDPKRRPTKIFKGSTDGALDWFPQGDGGDCASDDMVLMEHHHYNDGLDCREFNPLPGDPPDNPCSGFGYTGTNDNFPRNAARLVRTRRFTGNAEDCNTQYNEDTSSRDVRYLYDKRGRAVIQFEQAIGYPKTGGTSTLEDPKFISATTTVYDNLDRPVIVATWENFEQTPEVSVIEDWSVEEPDDVVEAILGASGVITLHQTRYDDRSRPYEQRRYNVDDTTASTYEFTRTFRDDLDQVVAELTPTGLTVNKYDSLGRVTETSWWAATTFDPGTEPSGVELTRTVTMYDPFGNVLTTTHYDRKDTSEDGPITTDLATSNAIVTFTHNWYDSAKRLVATANYGTYGPDGFTNAEEEPDYSAADPPEFQCTGTPPVCNYVIDGIDADLAPLVTRFGYDQAGRRIWTQDPKGIVTRTWYDLLGHTLLVAENWKDFPENSGPGGSNLHLGDSHSGPIRYTAYHYTRGGLLDAIVAVMDDDSNLEPGDFDWDEAPVGDDCKAGDTVEVSGGIGFQITRYRYEDNIVAEVLTATVDPNNPIARFPNLVSKVEYPDDSVLEFKYTIDGKLAGRKDSRNVELAYGYGTLTEDDGRSLSSVNAKLPTSLGTDLDGQRRSATYVHQHGLLTSARTHYHPTPTVATQVDFQYDGYQNLINETQTPLSGAESRQTEYVWSAAGVNTNRLEQIVYPSGMRIRFDYDSSNEDDAEDHIKRMTGLTEVYAPLPQFPLDAEPIANIITYSYTGGGKKKSQVWAEDSDPAVASLNLLPNPQNQIEAGIDRFGRTVDLRFHTFNSGAPIYQYKYGYDVNGNVVWNRITQPGNDNTRSFIYEYDQLNRLTMAERGQLAGPSNSAFTTMQTDGWNWTMDVLGNWTGDGSLTGLQNFTSTDTDPGYDSEHTDGAFATQQLGNDSNRINLINLPESKSQTVNYDTAGNLTKDDASNAGGEYAPRDHEYKYDAWNRLVQVKRRHAPTGSGSMSIVARYAYDALGRRVSKYVGNSGSLNTNGQAGDLLYYDGNRVIEQYAYIPPGGGGPGGTMCTDAFCGGGNPGGGPAKVRIENPSLGIRGRLRSDAELHHEIAQLGADAANTPVEFLRFMRPRAFTGADSQDDEEADDSESKINEESSLPTDDANTRVQLTSAKIHETSPSPAPVDHVYELNKADVDDPKDAVRQSGSGQYELFRTFVHGLEYVNELVMMADNHSAYYVLQDANYNVIALVDDPAYADFMTDYDPYGQMRLRADQPGGPWIPHEYNPADPRLFYDLPGFQGGTQDRETGLVCFGARCYDPDLGRWLQSDPNGTGLVLGSALRFHGQVPSVSTFIAASHQFGDGMSIYLPFGSNPISSHDPSGLFSLGELGAAHGIQGDLNGNYIDIGASTVDAMKGIAFLQMERYAVIDDMIEASASDWSGIDAALKIHDGYQSAQLGLFLGSAGGKLTGGALGLGKRAFNFIRNRAGGRGNLLDAFASGMNSIRNLFRLGGVGPGIWVPKHRNMKPHSRAFQRWAGGGEVGREYLVGGVHFDGFKDGYLIEAKGPGYDSFFSKSGNPRSLFTNRILPKAVKEATDQWRVRGRYPIRWIVADGDFAKALRTEFRRKGLGIEVLHVPAVPWE